MVEKTVYLGVSCCNKQSAPHQAWRDARIISLIGLGFGDCGKGLYTDYLTRELDAHTVVRFNGGGQAGHNVCLPDGRHHTFSQFGAGTFVPGVRTLLAYPVVVHPTALLVECEWLKRVGVHDALDRLKIDSRCRVTTPFHQAAGRLREIFRGTFAHGSCGVGVGETVGHGLQHPDLIVHFGDLAKPELIRDKLEAIRQNLLLSTEADAIAFIANDPAQKELAILRDEHIVSRWVAQLAPLTRASCIAMSDEVATLLNRPGTVIFEGAQGMLLDETYGFHPHTTWSDVTPSAAEAVASDAGFDGQLFHLGVMRTYLTRHGAGPLPTHDTALNTLSEAHNSGAGWQGEFRRGHPDAVLLRFALAAAGRIDGLVTTHHDVFDRGIGLKWCPNYDSACVDFDLPLAASQNLEHQARLTQALMTATPRYDPVLINSSDAWRRRVEDATTLPVLLSAIGPTHVSVRTHQKALWV